mgnify:CR=1 FL=1
MPRFFVDLPLSAGLLLDLPEAVVRHVQVLRLREGDALTLFNGRGGEYPASLQQLGKKSASALLDEHAAVSRESSLALTLVQAVSSGDRMDYTLQKAVELGVTAIQPVFSERSVVKLSGDRADKRMEHWRGVLIAACEQCGRNSVPSLLPLQPYGKWLTADKRAGLKLLLSPLGQQRLRDLPQQQQISLLAGPEGGLNQDEEAAAIAAGLDGIANKIEPPDIFQGDVYAAQSLPRVPTTLYEAIGEFERSDFAREAFGADVAEHYLHFIRTEQRKFDEVVTSWERARFFERA